MSHRRWRGVLGWKRTAEKAKQAAPERRDSLTSDRTDPRLGHGIDDAPVAQNAAYLVLSDEDRAKGFVRPVRRSYIHVGAPDGDPGCGALTTMSEAIAETYASEPGFYGATYCVGCRKHRPVGAAGEFVWAGTDERVGT